MVGGCGKAQIDDCGKSCIDGTATERPNEMNKEPFMYLISLGCALAAMFFLAGIRIVQPTNRGLVERLGKYRRLAMPGFNWLVPLIERMILVNLPESTVNATPWVYLHGRRGLKTSAKSVLLAGTFMATLFTGCWFTTGPGGVGITVVPALPVVVELQDDPYFYQSGYYYYYQDDRWSYASHKSGPWVELPRDRYPREVRYSGRTRRPVEEQAAVEERGQDRGHSKGNGRAKNEDRGHGGDKHDESRGPN